MNPEKQYDLCIFDLDGTLTDPKVGITKSYQYALAAFGIHKETDDLVKYIGAPLREMFTADFGLSDADTEVAVAKYREYFAETGLYENVVYPGIPEALQRLADSGKTLAVATNKVTSYAQIILEHFGLDHFFAFVSGDEMDGSLSKNGKRDIIRIALEHFVANGFTAPVMIGDRRHDITGAVDEGIDSIGITWGYGDRAELEEAGATTIVDSTDALCQLILSS